MSYLAQAYQYAYTVQETQPPQFLLKAYRTAQSVSALSIYMLHVQPRTGVHVQLDDMNKLARTLQSSRYPVLLDLRLQFICDRCVEPTHEHTEVQASRAVNIPSPIAICEDSV